MNERNLVQLFLNQADRYQSRAALRFKKDGSYRDISWTTFRNTVIRTALALHLLGCQKGERVALLSENRPEWAFADLAILSLGGIVVPIYPNASLKDTEHILTHCEASVLFISTPDQFTRLEPVLKNLIRLKKIIVLDPLRTSQAGVISLSEFTASVSTVDQSVEQLFRSWVERVDLDDLATIIYTSGTTGPAKGVMLSHRNFLVNCYDAKEALPLRDTDVSLSFLPLSHVFERMAGYYLPLLCGVTIAYAEHMNTVPENLIEVTPTVASGVPRFFEKMHAKITAEIKARGGLQELMFKWAVRVGKQSSQYLVRDRPLSLLLGWQRGLADRLVYSKVYQKLGGRLRCFISGGAPLAKELAEFFYSVGVLILEGYGLTETSPIISGNRLEQFKFGTVGLPLRHVETKIADDGEILVRGPSIMVGYYKDPKATEEAMKDGWFHTGDLGRFDSDGFLSVTGRKKDIIVTSGGKNISPQNIEELILSDPLISQIVVVGDKHNFITALIVPDFEQVKAVFKTGRQVTNGTPQELVQNPKVHQWIRSRIDERTKDLASYEQIKYFTLLPREFSQEREEVTLTLKIRRSVVQDHFREAIERMYRETEERAHEGRDRIFFVL